MKDIIYTVKEAENDMLLKDYLIKMGLSKTIIKKAKIDGIFVNGEKVTVRKVLKSSDNVRVILPTGSSESIEPISIPINIVFEDDYVLVVDKPTGMPTHPSKGNSLPTLANAIMAKMGAGFVFRAVNRLDRDTSGLVLIAKDAHCASKLSLSMKNRKIVKKYIALLDGIPENRNGIINAPIRRESEDSIKRIVAPDGKEAITEYKIIEEKDGCSLAEVTLHTGRTHQIRVHFAHIGHPLNGDFLYGHRNEEGYFLRCNYLQFEHPISGQIIKICI